MMMDRVVLNFYYNCDSLPSLGEVVVLGEVFGEDYFCLVEQLVGMYLFDGEVGE